MQSEKLRTAPAVDARREMMRTVAHASLAELSEAVGALGPLPAYVEVRKPEVGLVMLRGRIGGDGAAFNLGEATVTRAAVRLESGQLGFSYVLGRAPDKALAAAIIDALWQTSDGRERIEAAVLLPLRRMQAQRDAKVAAETAATRVDFFTLVRGEDQ
ncbi:MAG: phosphonate C-P lyase system protein PhnG [Hyphomicrobiaceae bacterium]